MLDSEMMDLPAVLELDDGDDEAPETIDSKQVTEAVADLFQKYASARTSRETVWRVAMTLYYASLGAYTQLASEAPEVLGKIKTDWRHKTHGPFCYENVETVVGYLMNATFPNEDFFTLDPTKTEDIIRAKIATLLMAKKLSHAQVKKHWEDMFRLQTILGFSVMSMPWEKREGVKKFRKKVEKTSVTETGEEVKEVVYEPATENYCVYDNLKLQVEDPTHIFLDPLANDANEGNIIRIVPMSLKDILGKMASGEFKGYSKEEVRKADQINTSSLSDSLFQEIQGYGSFSAQSEGEEYKVLEFYGDLRVGDDLLVDYHIVTLGSLLLICEPNDYWAGKPFVVSNYTRVQGRPYGMGLVEPSIGYYILVDVIQNQRLDAFELALNGGIIKVKEQCPMDAEDITVEPGKIWDVVEENDISLLELPLDNVRVGREEIQAIVEIIQRAGGNGNYVNANTARQGERVTAQEVETVRDAGGNRLRLVQLSGENSSFVLFLEKAFKMYTQCVDTEDTIRIIGQSALGRTILSLQTGEGDAELIEPGQADPTPPEYLFIKAGPEELAGYFDVSAKGSQYILDKAERFNESSQVLQLVLSNPLTANHVDTYQALVVLYEQSGVRGWERFLKENYQEEKLKKAAAEQAAAAAPSPMGGVDPNQVAGAVSQEPLLGGVSNPASGNPAGTAANIGAGGLEQVLQTVSGGAQTPGQIPAGAQV
jgi:Bacteriophage head to tail connecting protein